MAVKTVKVCDRCGAEVGVRTYAIRFPGQKGLLEFDLCREDSSYLDALKKLPKGRGRPARGIVPRRYDEVARDNGK